MNQLGVSFPPFPYTLYGQPKPKPQPQQNVAYDGFKPYGALNPQLRYGEDVNDDMVVVDSANPQSRSKKIKVPEKKIFF